MPRYNFRGLVVSAGCAAVVALSGCGGGGGDSTFSTSGNGGSGGSGTINTPSVVVLGKVVGPDGGPVAGASVTGGGSSAVTLSQGSFRLVDVHTGIVRVQASQTVNNVLYTGSTQALVINQRTTSGLTIEVSPSTHQAKIAGVVSDFGGNPIPDARVFLAVYTTPPPSTGGGDVASLVAITDDQGRYEIDNVPTNVSQYTIAASLQGYQNTSQPVQNLGDNEKRTVDLSLQGSAGGSVTAPQNLSLQSFTQPSFAVSNAIAKNSTTTASAYETVRELLSPKYAQLIHAKHSPSSIKHLSSRVKSSISRDDAIEIDAFFTESSFNDLSGYRIYNAVVGNALQPYDFLQDPLANFWSDVDSFYVPDTTYKFAISAIDNSQNETALSNQASVTPLELVNANTPVLNSATSNPVTFAWNQINNAASYTVLIYDRFPGAEVQPVYTSPTISSSQSSFTMPRQLATGDYWYIVAASNSDSSAISVSQIIRFHVN